VNWLMTLQGTNNIKFVYHKYTLNSSVMHIPVIKSSVMHYATVLCMKELF